MPHTHVYTICIIVCAFASSSYSYTAKYYKSGKSPIARDLHSIQNPSRFNNNSITWQIEIKYRKTHTHTFTYVYTIHIRWHITFKFKFDNDFMYDFGVFLTRANYLNTIS